MPQLLHAADIIVVHCKHEDNFEFQKTENSQNSLFLHTMPDARPMFEDDFDLNGLNFEFCGLHLIRLCETVRARRKESFGSFEFF